jgi:poly-gamma-glutamate synthesis protein (capsule biosynthesis protein)
MMLDRFVREQININGPEYPFEKIKDFISNNDIVVANAKGPFTSFGSVTAGKKDAPLNFTFDPMILPTLKKLGFTLLGQANNHTLNFGMKGFEQSTSSIMAAGLNYFGNPRNIDIQPYVKEINGEKIGFVAYNEFTSGGLDNVISTIKNLRSEVSFLVVYPHWGIEYNSTSTSAQREIAHKFVDAGADLVIGTHPHIIEPIEIYNGKPIFYSIGNFIFDQNQTGPTSQGPALKILINKNSANYQVFPFSIIHCQAMLMNATETQTILNSLSESADVATDIKKSIANGVLEIAG